MRQLILRLIIVMTGVLIVIACIYLNYINLIEAFGSGPPYYGRTTNMEKWSDPIPFLAALDGVVIAMFGGLTWLYMKVKKKGEVSQG